MHTNSFSTGNYVELGVRHITPPVCISPCVYHYHVLTLVCISLTRVDITVLHARCAFVSQCVVCLPPALLIINSHASSRRFITPLSLLRLTLLSTAAERTRPSTFALRARWPARRSSLLGTPANHPFMPTIPCHAFHSPHPFSHAPHRMPLAPCHSSHVPLPMPRFSYHAPHATHPMPSTPPIHKRTDAHTHPRTHLLAHSPAQIINPTACQRRADWLTNTLAPCPASTLLISVSGGAKVHVPKGNPFLLETANCTSQVFVNMTADHGVYAFEVCTHATH